MDKVFWVEMYPRPEDAKVCPACGDKWSATGNFIEVDETRYCYCGIKELIRAEMYGIDYKEIE